MSKNTIVANLYSTTVAVADPYAAESVILINTAIIFVSSDVASDGIEVGVSDLLKLCRVKDPETH